MAARLEGTGNPFPGAEVLSEIGIAYIYIDKSCNFWVKRQLEIGEGGWPAARSGILSSTEMSELAGDLQLNAWQSLSGEWWAEGSHLPARTWFDGSNTLRCIGECSQAEGAPEAVVSIDENTFGFLTQPLGWLRRLWDQGQQLDGPIRAQAHPRDPGGRLDEAEIRDWPLTWPLADIALGESVRISEPGDVTQLRSLLEEYHSDHLPPGKINTIERWGRLTFRDASDGAIYDFWMRDSLPFEDALGLIPVSAFAVQ